MECVPEAKMPTDWHSQGEKFVVKELLKRASKLEQSENFEGNQRTLGFVLESVSHYLNQK